MKQETEAAHKGRSGTEAEGVAEVPVARLPEGVGWVRKTRSRVRAGEETSHQHRWVKNRDRTRYSQVAVHHHAHVIDEFPRKCRPRSAGRADDDGEGDVAGSTFIRPPGRLLEEEDAAY